MEIPSRHVDETNPPKLSFGMSSATSTQKLGSLSSGLCKKLRDLDVSLQAIHVIFHLVLARGAGVARDVPLELCLGVGKLQGSNDILHHVEAQKQADDSHSQKYCIVEERVFQVRVAVGAEDSRA